MNKTLLPLVLIMIVFNFSCKKEKTAAKINIEGFQMFDPQGNEMGSIGSDDNDWELTDWSTLSSFEQSILNSSDNVNTSTLIRSMIINNSHTHQKHTSISF